MIGTDERGMPVERSRWTFGRNATSASPMPPTGCTDCGKPSGRLKWYPFLTYACPGCAAKGDARAEQERRLGDVCGMCRKPYSLCVC